MSRTKSEEKRYINISQIWWKSACIDLQNLDILDHIWEYQISRNEIISQFWLGTPRGPSSVSYFFYRYFSLLILLCGTGWIIHHRAGSTLESYQVCCSYLTFTKNTSFCKSTQAGSILQWLSYSCVTNQVSSYLTSMLSTSIINQMFHLQKSNQEARSYQLYNH